MLNLQALRARCKRSAGGVNTPEMLNVQARSARCHHLFCLAPRASNGRCGGGEAARRVVGCARPQAGLLYGGCIPWGPRFGSGRLISDVLRTVLESGRHSSTPRTPHMTTHPPTPSPEVNAVLDRLHQGVSSILGTQLAGLYLHGSLALGDLNPASSDIDPAARSIP